jgi:hypothetical protein
MSRYTIIVTRNGRCDPDAVIGYDPPLRTFYLQAFPDQSGDDLALWLGTNDREYDTLEELHAAALARGFDFMPLPADIIAGLAADLAAEAGRSPHDGPLAVLLRHLQLAFAKEARAGRSSGAGLFFCQLERYSRTSVPPTASR